MLGQQIGKIPNNVIFVFSNSLNVNSIPLTHHIRSNKNFLNHSTNIIYTNGLVRVARVQFNGLVDYTIVGPTCRLCSKLSSSRVRTFSINAFFCLGWVGRGFGAMWVSLSPVWAAF